MSSSPVASALSPLIEPRVASLPKNVGTRFTPQLNDWLVSLGVTLDAWQRRDLGRWMAVDASGNWAATEVGELVARQNGKGEILLAYDLLHLFVVRRQDNRPKTLIHTSHEVKTNAESLAKLVSVIESSPQLSGRVSQIYTGNNEQGVRLKPRPGQRRGDRAKFVARSKNSARGLTADVIVYDEAQELSQAAHRALSYTLTTTRNRQEVFTGTVPEEGVNDAEIWEGIRDRGRAGVGKFPRTCWTEYSPRGSDDPKVAKKLDLGNEVFWEAGNPAIDIRVFRESIAEELERDRSPDKEGFARERLSIWPNRGEAEVVKLSELNMEKWRTSANEEASVQGGGVVLAVAVGATGQYGTIGKAVRVDDERVAVEHHKTAGGTRWIAQEVKQLASESARVMVVLDPKNASPILAGLKKERVRFLAMSLDEIAAAQSLFVEYVNAGLVVHRPQAEVEKSLEFATTRPLGRAGVTWEASDSKVPVSITQAVTWAFWGVLKAETNPERDVPPPVSAVLAGEPIGGPDLNLRDVRF